MGGDSFDWTRRKVRAVGTRLRAPAVRLGLLSYRAPTEVSVESYAETYESGGYEYFADLDELARYSVVRGYVSRFGKGAAIIDIGCGPGLLRPHIDGVEFRSYLGVDPVAEVIEAARTLEDERTSFSVADGTDAALGQFDLVTVVEVIYCSPDPAALIANAHERLAPGGYLISSNLRHAGDSGLHRMLGAGLELVDAVEARNLTSPERRHRRWLVSVHRKPE